MKKIVTRVIAAIVLAAMLFTLAGAQDSYGDLFGDTQNNSQPVQTKEYKQKFWDVDKSHWAFNAIAELTDRGAINGYANGSFKPENTVTRAEWAKIMIMAAGLTPNDNSVKFTDMKGHWAIAYVNAASDYLTAFADNSYRPDQAVTREDVTMAMVKLKGYDLNEVDYSVLSRFKDVASISNSIKVYVAVAVEKGLIAGFDDGTFRGQATLTRAQAATLLWRAFQFGNDNKGTAGSAASSGNTAANTTTNNTGSSVTQQSSNSSAGNNVTVQTGTAITVGALPGVYSDAVSKRANMTVKQKNDIYKVNISWASSADETTEWYFDAKIDKATGDLTYENGYEFNVVSNEDGTVSYNLENDKCKGKFIFSGSTLVWNDLSEDLSERCRFEKSAGSEKDYAAQYASAKSELDKYLNVCMVTDIFEDGKKKEIRLSEQYNLVCGLLLSCMGYGDSDALLAKVSSVHKMALQLAESANVIIQYSDYSFPSGCCLATMRDTTARFNCNDFKTGEDAELTLDFAYDGSTFNAEMTDLFISCRDEEPVRFIVSMFAANYKDAEFKRLLGELYDKIEYGKPIDIEIYYGGYNIEIFAEEVRNYNTNITIKGTKGAKKTTSGTSANYSNNVASKNTITQPAVKEEEKEPQIVETPKAETQEYDYEQICNYCEHSDGMVKLTLKNGVKTDVKWTCSSCEKENWNYVTLTW